MWVVDAHRITSEIPNMSAGLVVVYDCTEPWHKLMSWFLSDAGIDNARVSTLQDLTHVLGSTPCTLIVNSCAKPEEIGHIVAEIRRTVGGDLRIVVLHHGKHREDKRPVDADVCVHCARDVDSVIDAVRVVLNDDRPHGVTSSAGVSS